MRGFLVVIIVILVGAFLLCSCSLSMGESEASGFGVEGSSWETGENGDNDGEGGLSASEEPAVTAGSLGGNEPTVPTGNLSEVESIESTGSFGEEETAPTEEEKAEQLIETIIDGMSLREQISGLFIIEIGEGTTELSDDLETFISSAGAGGYVLFANNITNEEGTRALTDAINELSAIAPFICIDEEGGTVSRLGSARLSAFTPQPTARSIGATGDTTNAYLSGEAIGMALGSIGVNVNFAPVADVLTNPANRVIGSRSFGSDPELVSDMASAFQLGLRDHGIMSAPKHFPGHGNTAADSHMGPAVINSDAEHLAAVEYIPFRRLIEEGAEFVMLGHITVPKADPEGLPATLSKYFATDVLRGELGFGGIIITDAMNMGAITNSYSSAEAAVMAIQAGADMILMPQDFEEAVEGLLVAIDEGAIQVGRIRESLIRILKTKLMWDLI